MTHDFFPGVSSTTTVPLRNLRRAAAIFDARSVPLVLNQVGIR